MKIEKSIQGHNVELELIKIKDYSRYSLYQVYKLVNGKRIAIYQECYTNLQIQEIKRNKNIITDEEVFK